MDCGQGPLPVRSESRARALRTLGMEAPPQLAGAGLGSSTRSTRDGLRQARRRAHEARVRWAELCQGAGDQGQGQRRLSLRQVWRRGQAVRRCAGAIRDGCVQSAVRGAEGLRCVHRSCGRRRRDRVPTRHAGDRLSRRGGAMDDFALEPCRVLSAHRGERRLGDHRRRAGSCSRYRREVWRAGRGPWPRKVTIEARPGGEGDRGRGRCCGQRAVFRARRVAARGGGPVRAGRCGAARRRHGAARASLRAGRP